jgi:N-acetylmuramoyl-L-alanine amidase
MGLELVRRLEATRRYRVHLTRRDDRFVRLRDRVNAARAHGADLFISLHADSIGRPGHRGVTVYTVSETASDREAEALAAKENKADIIVGVDLGGTTAEVAGILIDLSQRETKNKSTRFARALVEELGKETRLVDQTHRFAGFAVLSAPDVPSVLLELGYLSNREDERQLRTPAHRARLADAAVRAVDRYFAKPTPELVAVQAAATPDSLRRR